MGLLDDVRVETESEGGVYEFVREFCFDAVVKLVADTHKEFADIRLRIYNRLQEPRAKEVLNEETLHEIGDLFFSHLAQVCRHLSTLATAALGDAECGKQKLDGLPDWDNLVQMIADRAIAVIEFVATEEPEPE